jgi:putative drug exporter of the RND superfamily
MRTLASRCFRHRRAVLAAWLVALVGLTALQAVAGSNYNDTFSLPGTQSFEALNLLERNAHKQSGDLEQIVIAVKRGRVTEPAVRARVRSMLAAVARLPHVTVVGSPYAPGASDQISPSGRVAFANVTFDVLANAVPGGPANTFVNTAKSAGGHGVEVEVEGQIAEAGAQPSSKDVAIGFLAAAAVLFLVFGSPLAMALPLLTAGLSLGTGIAAIGLLSNVISMASFSSQLSLLIGLGVGIDYALFIVTRYRQGLLRGLSGEEAAVEAVDTSGRAVLFAGIIVCIALLGMLTLGVSFLYGVAIAAAIAVAFTVLASLTLLPALLGFLGPRVLRRRERRQVREGTFTNTDESPAWARWAGWLRAHPAPFVAIAAGVMIVLSIPFSSMRLGSSDAGTDPAGTTTRKAYDLLAEGFGPGYNGPLQLVAQVSSPAQRAAFVRVVDAVARTPGAAGSTTPVFTAGRDGRSGVATADVYPKGSPQAVSTANLLDTVRDSVVPAAERGTGLHVLVGGETAIFDDFARVLSSKLPLFIGVVVLLSFLLLTAVFRSLVIPSIAAVMNLLSAGASFGVITAVFQKGWGASLIGVNQTAPIEAFLPVLMFAILFGLSMDYEVFLVSRIYEEWHRRGENGEAVSHGLAATGRTITAAAAIMVLVFGSFVLGGNRIIDLFGIGLASAVLLDALIIRAVLVPATMLLLGKANWWLPAALDRRLPRLGIEGAGGGGAGARTEPAAPFDPTGDVPLPEPAPG